MSDEMLDPEWTLERGYSHAWNLLHRLGNMSREENVRKSSELENWERRLQRAEVACTHLSDALIAVAALRAEELLTLEEAEAALQPLEHFIDRYNRENAPTLQIIPSEEGYAFMLSALP